MKQGAKFTSPPLIVSGCYFIQSKMCIRTVFKHISSVYLEFRFFSMFSSTNHFSGCYCSSLWSKITKPNFEQWNFELKYAKLPWILLWFHPPVFQIACFFFTLVGLSYFACFVSQKSLMQKLCNSNLLKKIFEKSLQF